MSLFHELTAWPVSVLKNYYKSIQKIWDIYILKINDKWLQFRYCKTHTFPHHQSWTLIQLLFDKRVIAVSESAGATSNPIYAGEREVHPKVAAVFLSYIG